MLTIYASHSYSKDQQRERNVIGIGLIGAGRIGTLHAEAIAAARNCRVAAIYDDRPAAAERLAATVGGRVCDSAASLAANPDVAAVFICSPTDTHVAMVAVAAQAGKAVFCEKPIDLEVTRVEECLAIL